MVLQQQEQEEQQGCHTRKRSNKVEFEFIPIQNQSFRKKLTLEERQQKLIKVWFKNIDN